MDRDELALLMRIKTVLLDYSFNDILELNDMTEEETLKFLIQEYGLELPENEPIDS